MCGFTEGKGNRKHFGALLLGAYRNRRRRYFDYSGTGFSEKGLKEAIDRLKPFFIDKSPVENPPKIPEKIQWVQPRLVCEVAYTLSRVVSPTRARSLASTSSRRSRIA